MNEKSAMFSTPAPFALSLSKGKRGVLQHPVKAVARLWQDPEALRAMQESFQDLKKGKAIKLTGKPSVGKILAAARKKCLMGG